MSDALVWELVKRNSCFLVKKGVSGHGKSCNNHSASYQFTSEPGNLQNVNSFTNSGLANSKAINIDIQPYLKLDRKPAITEKDAKNKPFFSQKGKKRLTSGNAFASSAIPNGARISAKKIQNRTADYRNDGHTELIVCSDDGEVRAYLPAGEELSSKIGRAHV